MNLAFGFIVRNIEDGGSRCFYAHENNGLQDCFKLVCTRDDLTKRKKFCINIDVKVSCSRERMNTKWKFCKLKNLIVFAALLRDVPMGCKDAVLPELLLKNHIVIFLTYEEITRQPYRDSLWLLCALVLQLLWNERLEEKTYKSFILLISRMDGLSPRKFKGVHMRDLPIVEDLL